jgi:hypothetical protein
VAGKSLGEVHDFQEGRWLEFAIGPEQSTDGKIPIRVRNARQGANAVLSIIEWVGSREG